MRTDIIIKDFNNLKNKYNGLFLLNTQNKIVGRISFIDEDTKLLCEYDVEILISSEYPNEPPKIKEISEKISREFHTNSDGSLCLGSNLDVSYKFSLQPTLLGFVEQLVEPYLFSHTYFKKYKTMPFGELDHGAKGILQYYKELFDDNNYEMITKILHFLCKYGFRGHHQCCCGSEKKFRDCHGHVIKKMGININQFRKIIIKDFFLCLSIAPNKAPELGLVSNFVLSTLGKMQVKELFDCNISIDEKILVFEMIVNMLLPLRNKVIGRKKEYIRELIFSINSRIKLFKEMH